MEFQYQRAFRLFGQEVDFYAILVPTCLHFDSQNHSKSCLGGVLGVILAVLAAPEGLLERLGLVLGHLEGILDHLGVVLGRLGGVLDL